MPARSRVPFALSLIAATAAALLWTGRAAEPEGAEMIGRRFPDLGGIRWLTEDHKPPRGDGVRARLIRWWTDTCPYCEASLPALDLLRRRYGSSGLQVIGIYHPKPPRAVGETVVLEAARLRRFAGIVGIDGDWSLLRRAWLSGARRRATSVSFLLDADGIIRSVHPGPEIHPSSDPAHTACDHDFAKLEAAIRELVRR